MASNGSIRDTRFWNVPVVNTSDPNYLESSKYRTWCGCHVRTCAFVIGLLETIALIASLVATALAYVLFWQYAVDGHKEKLSLDHHASLSLIGSGIAVLIGVIAIGLLFFGLAKERPTFLIPHMIVQFLAIIGLMAAMVVFIYIAAVVAEKTTLNAMRNIGVQDEVNSTDATNQPQHWPHFGAGRMFIYSVTISSLCFVAFLLEIYFLVAIYKAYAYFCMKREELKKQSGPVTLWGTGSSIRGGEDSVVAARIWSEIPL